MSTLSERDRIALKRAGFTDREISTYRQKFYNLLNVAPMMTDEFKDWQQSRKQCEQLLAAMDKIANEARNIGSARIIARASISSVKGSTK